MPHQCTECGKTFADGSTEMLSGCPECGGNKFQYLPDTDEETPANTESPPEPPEPPVDSSVARTVGNAATAVRDLVGSNSAQAAGPPETAQSEATQAATDASVESNAAAVEENAAQASARSEVVSKEDLPAPETATTTAATTDPSVASGDDRPESLTTDPEQHGSDERDRPGLDQLREELNDQFESIKVLQPGQYELNLMELYDREEFIIALQEDGKYTIQVPEQWDT